MNIPQKFIDRSPTLSTKATLIFRLIIDNNDKIDLYVAEWSFMIIWKLTWLIISLVEWVWSKQNINDKLLTGVENNSTQNNRAYNIYVPSLNLRVDSNLISSVQVHVAKPVVTKCIKIEIKDRN